LYIAAFLLKNNSAAPADNTIPAPWKGLESSLAA
jgi:hypothetical protein